MYLEVLNLDWCLWLFWLSFSILVGQMIICGEPLMYHTNKIEDFASIVGEHIPSDHRFFFPRWWCLINIALIAFHFLGASNSLPDFLNKSSQIITAELMLWLSDALPEVLFLPQGTVSGISSSASKRGFIWRATSPLPLTNRASVFSLLALCVHILLHSSDSG